MADSGKINKLSLWTRDNALGDVIFNYSPSLDYAISYQKRRSRKSKIRPATEIFLFSVLYSDGLLSPDEIMIFRIYMYILRVPFEILKGSNGKEAYFPTKIKSSRSDQSTWLLPLYVMARESVNRGN